MKRGVRLLGCAEHNMRPSAHYFGPLVLARRGLGPGLDGSRLAECHAFPLAW